MPGVGAHRESPGRFAASAAAAPRGSRPAVEEEEEEVALEYVARIKVHEPCGSGVLVELAGEFDASCLEALAEALQRASRLGWPIFADLAAVTFMDTSCVRELAVGPLAPRLCVVSREFELSLTACGLEGRVATYSSDDPGYQAVILEACRCAIAERAARRSEHRLYIHAGSRTQWDPAAVAKTRSHDRTSGGGAPISRF